VQCFAENKSVLALALSICIWYKYFKGLNVLLPHILPFEAEHMFYKIKGWTENILERFQNGLVGL